MSIVTWEVGVLGMYASLKIVNPPAGSKRSCQAGPGRKLNGPDRAGR